MRQFRVEKLKVLVIWRIFSASFWISQISIALNVELFNFESFIALVMILVLKLYNLKLFCLKASK